MKLDLDAVRQKHVELLIGVLEVVAHDAENGIQGFVSLTGGNVGVEARNGALKPSTKDHIRKGMTLGRSPLGEKVLAVEIRPSLLDQEVACVLFDVVFEESRHVNPFEHGLRRS